MVESELKEITIHEVDGVEDLITATGRQIKMMSDSPVIAGLDDWIRPQVIEKGAMALRKAEFEPIFLAIEEAQKKLVVKQNTEDVSAIVDQVNKKHKFALIQGGKGGNSERSAG